jgi:hypothetical protein
MIFLCIVKWKLFITFGIKCISTLETGKKFQFCCTKSLWCERHRTFLFHFLFFLVDLVCGWQITMVHVWNLPVYQSERFVYFSIIHKLTAIFTRGVSTAPKNMNISSSHLQFLRSYLTLLLSPSLTCFLGFIFVYPLYYFHCMKRGSQLWVCKMNQVSIRIKTHYFSWVLSTHKIWV